MKKYKVFIACDSKNIKKVSDIIKKTRTSKLDIGYKFQDFGKASGFNKVDSASGSTDVDPKKFKVKTHSATLGVRFNF